MSAPSELSFDEILKFMLAHNGKVTNFELVKHFKPFLTDPDKKDEARSIFKKHVNTLASIKTQNDEKWLVLKRKYCVNKDESVEEMGSIETSTKLGDESVSSELSLNAPQPPPYIPPPSVENNNTGESPVLDVTENTKDLHHENVEQSLRPVSQTSLDIEITHPVVHSRKKSNADKVERKSISVPKPGLKSSLSCHDDIQNMKENLPLTRSEGNIISDNCETEQTMSVKERKQMFNRMASEGDATALRPLRIIEIVERQTMAVWQMTPQFDLLTFQKLSCFSLRVTASIDMIKNDSALSSGSWTFVYHGQIMGSPFNKDKRPEKMVSARAAFLFQSCKKKQLYSVIAMPAERSKRNHREREPKKARRAYVSLFSDARIPEITRDSARTLPDTVFTPTTYVTQKA
ncbi:Ankyrin repeat domain-containing protein SOWAHB [Eumeta japonica]|uniref:Ankyrin repeat domain-containing protein SOWAHB n=1 Tax=Eumeta variegata TaxID=151549 RepID=A0A4C2AEH5_EUMVA|nr:Ankyrin repeat domain-containing protein SOWAHB [Eumeta japonica]